MAQYAFSSFLFSTMQEDGKSRLDSWKTIAEYLHRDVTTAIRWEREKGLPVHRVPGGRRQAVFAYRDEIDDWLMNGGRNSAEAAAKANPELSPEPDGASVDVIPGPRYPGPPSISQPWLRYVAAVGTAALAATLAWGAYEAFRPQNSPMLLDSEKLTNDNRPKVCPITDGKRIYFAAELPPGQRIESVSVNGGAIVQLPLPLTGAVPLDTSPDRSSVLILAHFPARPDPVLFAADLQDGSLRRVGDVSVTTAAWSPSGRSIIYATGLDLVIAASDGSNPRKLVAVPGIHGSYLTCLHWSPDGNRVRFTLVKPGAPMLSIWEVAADGHNLRPLLPEWKSASQCEGNWTPNGRFYVFQSPCDSVVDENIWVLPERGWLFSRAEPEQLTKGPLKYSRPVPSLDGKAIFVVGTNNRTELFAWSSQLREFVPYLGGISADWVTYSPEGERIAYVASPDGTLWRAGRQGEEPHQLTFAPMRVAGCSWSPDGKRIALRAQKGRGKPYTIYLLNAEGGEPEELLPGDDREEGIPSWSADGQQIIYGEVPTFVGSGTGKEVIHVCDVATRRVSVLPRSEGLWTSRWSPDGRYIAALTIDVEQRLKLYNTKISRWIDVGVNRVDNPVWSHDGQYIYFAQSNSIVTGPIFRVRVSDGNREEVATLGSLRRMGWAGITPDGSPLILRDAGTQELYRLDVDWR